MPTDESSMIRLAGTRDSDGSPFLQAHHMLAASRLERLIQKAQLAPRLTMSYDSGRTGERGQTGSGTADIADSASHARQSLNRLALALPVDCWGVLFDVCGLGKGLQLVETERRWPRRSAKLVLRIGLSQLVAHWELTPQAQGAEQGPVRGWRSERLPIIPSAGS